jgi:SAM-dependent methyltransferase
MSSKYSKEQHLKMNQSAWDEAHRVEAAKMRKDPNWGDEFRNGGVTFDDTEIELLGNALGLDVLQLSCGGDASQAFSLANLGARVTACDFSPVAIEMAKENALKIGLDVRFIVDDSQRLSSFNEGQFDLVHADYNLWSYEDLPSACENWYRVLRDGGRLVLHEEHPITLWCLEEDRTSGGLKVTRSYGDRTPEYYHAADDSGPLSFGDPELEWVEFPHTMADILNAIVQPGFIIEKMIERVRENTKGTAKGVLPSDFFVVARKHVRHLDHLRPVFRREI